MELVINGAHYDWQQPPRPANLAQLLAHLAVIQQRIAVEHNQQLVARTQWEQTPLHAQDQIEIVRAIGGG